MEWAQEAPRKASIAIVVQLPTVEHHPEAALTLAHAVRNNFDERSHHSAAVGREQRAAVSQR